jgi:hypothetical protein
VGIDNLANFPSISPNQTKFLSSVCLVPGLDFSAITVSISAVSLGRLSTYIYFLDFKVLNGQFPLYHILQILFEYCKYVNFNIHDSNIEQLKF